jgi:hypothetical protein
MEWVILILQIKTHILFLRKYTKYLGANGIKNLHLGNKNCKNLKNYR